MRRVGRLPLAAIAALAAIGCSVLVVVALLDLGADPAPPVSSPSGSPGLGAGDLKRAGGPGDSPVGRPRSLLSSDADVSWEDLQRELPAQIGASVVMLGHGPARDFGLLRSGRAWSTIKVPILVTLMREGGALDSGEDAWARAALSASDNEAAAALFARIEASRGGLVEASEAIEATLRAGGDRATVVSTAPPPSGAVSTYGQTDWSLSTSARFFAALAEGCLLDRAETDYVLGLSEEVVAEQRWGLGAAEFEDAGWQVAFKGGWGPEGSASGPYLVRQTAVLRHGDSGLAVAIAARDSSGSFEAGVDAVDRIAAWLAENLRDPAPGPPGERACPA